MRESWVIAAFYFQRLARKPLLIAFLLAIPFTLLLAEFAAFGRAAAPKSMDSVPVRVVLDHHSGLADRFVHCLAQQKDHPLQVGEDSGGPGDVITLTGTSPIRVTIGSTTPSRVNLLLEHSIVSICTTQEQLQAARPAFELLVQRSAANPNNIALSRAIFFARFFPGLALFGALFLSQAMASLVWRDFEKNVQQRLRTMPVAPFALVLGPILFLTTGAAAGLLLVLAVCAFAANPSAMASPIFWAILIGFAICAAGLQLTTGLVARSHRAATAISASTNMMLAFLGGGFVPLSVYPPFLRVVAYALPNGAGQAGLVQTLEGLTNPNDIIWRVATIWIWAAVLISTAIALQNRRMRT